ncbi:MAG: tellurite resistance/C4-dicarboxylate transporter family protein, partial [Pseudonocardiaceae bacterium]
MTGGWLTRLDPPPDVFAVVMATGIVSVAAYDHHYWRLGIALSILAVVAFVVLVLGVLGWVATRFRHVTALMRDPDVALRMFTFVAACAVLGVRWNGHPVAAWLLGGIALMAWLGLAPLAVVDVGSRPVANLRAHAHGAWLLPSVATAGLAATSANLAVHVHARALVTTATVAWLLGMVLYLAVTWLIAWRALAAKFVPEEVTPDSWILMGALAIITLSGAHLITAAPLADPARWIMDVIKPVTLGTWIVASLWIPLLLYAEVWRVDQRAGSLRFAGVWWSAVFPLGMY